MVCPVERGFCVVARPRPRPACRIATSRGARRGPARPDLAPRPRALVQLPDDRGPADRPQLPGPRAGARHCLRQRPAARRGLSSSSAAVVASFLALCRRRTRLAERPSTANIIDARGPRPATSARSRTGRRFAAWRATAAWARSAAARTTRRSSAAGPATLSQYASAPWGSSARFPPGLHLRHWRERRRRREDRRALEKYNRASVATVEAIRDGGAGRPAAPTCGWPTPWRPHPTPRSRCAGSWKRTPAPHLSGRFEQFLQRATRIFPAVADPSRRRRRRLPARGRPPWSARCAS